MQKKLFSRLVESMRQMDEIARAASECLRVSFSLWTPPKAEIRALTGFSQPKFARILHVDVERRAKLGTGRREPTGPARALLRAIKNDPRAVLKALAA